jgi:hypothetical protein
MKKITFTMITAFLVAFSLCAQKANQNNLQSVLNLSSSPSVNAGNKYFAEGKTVKLHNILNTKATIFSEDFSEGILPVGWDTIDNTGGGVWVFNNPGEQIINTTTAANGFAIFDSDDLGNDGLAENADLISPAFDCSGLTAVKLSFEHYFEAGFGGSAEVFVSGDNGTNWTSLQAWSATSTANAEAAEYNISAIAAGHSQVKIKWRWIGDYSWYWAVDDILVFAPETHDLTVTNITPKGFLLSGSTVAPVVTVENVGATAEASYSVTLKDGAAYNQTVNVSTSIAPDSTYDVTFPNWTPADGDNTLTAFVTVALDGNTANDTLDQDVTVTPQAWVAATGTIPAPVYLGASAGYFNGTNHFLYSIGGNDNVSGIGTNLSIYNIETSTWSAGAVMPDTSLVNCAVTVGDYIYVLQGSDANSVYTNVFYKYDIAGNSWSTLANLPIALGWTNIAAINGNIYCVGGHNGSSAVNTTYRYNISTNTWTTSSAISSITGVFGGSLVATDNKLVYIQGIVNDVISGNVYIGTVDGSNPDLITWTSGAVCPTGGVYKIKADLWSPCEVIYTGGNDGVAGGYWGAVPKTYIYNIINNSWTALQDKTTPAIGYAAATFLIDDEIRYYVATGFDASGAGQLSNVEYFSSPLPTEILTFDFNGLTPAVVGVVNATSHTVSLIVPFGTDVTALIPTIVTSCGTTISPESGVAQDFTNPVTYTVTATDGVTTQNWTVTVNVAPAGIDDNNANETLSVYPNPSKDIVNVIMNTTIKQIVIVNLQGQVVSETLVQSNEATINTSDLINGIYFLRIYTDNGVTMRKIQILK